MKRWQQSGRSLPLRKYNGNGFFLVSLTWDLKQLYVRLPPRRRHCVCCPALTVLLLDTTRSLPLWT